MTLLNARISGITRSRILVAERNEGFRQWLVNSLREWGYDPVIVRDLPELMTHLEHDDQPTVFLDAELHSSGSLVAYGQLLLAGFAPRLISLCDENRSIVAQRALKMGALAVLGKQCTPTEAKTALSSVIHAPASRNAYGVPLLGSSSAIRELRELIRNVAASEAAVMILGESGTGKELVARAIHDCSIRATKEFVPVNMGALPSNLVESMLFGHERGAFTGADQGRVGICEHAHEGTLFLDEIGEMSLELQPKLLRFLQSQTIQRVGANEVRKVDTRIVSATNRTVDALIQSGMFREDLFFRLHVVPIEVPPLRDRVDDIPLLANMFLERKCQRTKRQLSFSDDALEKLTQYSWPGNVRQLENFVERMMVMTRNEVIELDSLPPEWFSAGFASSAARRSIPMPRRDAEHKTIVSDRELTRMEAAERKLIIEALNQHNGVVSDAARFLGVGQATIYRKIRTFEIPKSR